MLITFTQQLIYPFYIFTHVFSIFLLVSPGKRPLKDAIFILFTLFLYIFNSSKFTNLANSSNILPVIVTMHVSFLQALQQNKTFGMPSQTLFTSIATKQKIRNAFPNTQVANLNFKNVFQSPLCMNYKCDDAY